MIQDRCDGSVDSLDDGSGDSFPKTGPDYRVGDT